MRKSLEAPGGWPRKAWAQMGLRVGVPWRTLCARRKFLGGTPGGGDPGCYHAGSEVRSLARTQLIPLQRYRNCLQTKKLSSRECSRHWNEWCILKRKTVLLEWEKLLELMGKIPINGSFIPIVFILMSLAHFMVPVTMEVDFLRPVKFL